MRLRLRASSIPTLLDCPARWKAEQVDGLSMPVTMSAWVGTVLHNVTASYDLSRQAGGDPRLSEFAPDLRAKILDPPVPVRRLPRDPDPLTAVRAAWHTFRLYATTFALKGWDLVEHTLQPTVYTVDGIEIEVTGTLDRARRIKVAVTSFWHVTDLKSGRWVFTAQGEIIRERALKHAPQLDAYQRLLAAETGEPVLQEANVVHLRTTPPAGIGRNTIEAQGLPEAVHRLSRYARMRVFPGNPESTLCHPDYCPVYATCEWRQASGKPDAEPSPEPRLPKRARPLSTIRGIRDASTTLY